MRARLLCTTGIVLASLAAPGLQGAQSDGERHVFVTALDKTGTPIVGLTTEHFAVRESGRDRTVLRVEPLRVPMHVAVLIDTSLSSGSPDESLRSAIVAFVERLAASNHVAVYAFGDRAARVVPFTQDAAQLRSAMTGMFGWSHQRSYLIDVVDLALRDFERIESPRPVIIAISSESPEASTLAAGGVLKRLVAQSIALHSISLAISTGSGQTIGIAGTIPERGQRLGAMAAAGEGDRERAQLLQQGTAATGGGRQRVTSTLAIAAALGRVAGELANSYRVTFTRPGSVKMQNLQVGVMAEGITLRAIPAPSGTR